MRTLVTTMLISTLLVSACGRDSRMNPRNWFGSGQPERTVRTTATGEANPLIPERRDSIFRRRSEEVYEGTPIDTVSELSIEPSAGGAIVKVTGIALRQGAHDVRLRPLNDGEPVEGVLTFTLDALQPENRPQGPEQTRIVRAGHFISSQTLDEITAVRVIAARNSQISSRR